MVKGNGRWLAFVKNGELVCFRPSEDCTVTDANPILTESPENMEIFIHRLSLLLPSSVVASRKGIDTYIMDRINQKRGTRGAFN